MDSNFCHNEQCWNICVNMCFHVYMDVVYACVCVSIARERAFHRLQLFTLAKYMSALSPSSILEVGVSLFNS